MKTLKRLSLSAVVVMGTASLAMAQNMPSISGTLGAAVGVTDVDIHDGDDSTQAVANIDMKVNFAFSKNFAVQTDAWYEVTSSYDEASSSSSDAAGDYRRNVTIAAHFAYRDPSRFAAGVFTGWTQANQFDTDAGTSRFLWGVEGQYYLDKFTLYGQVGRSEFLDGDDDHSEMVSTVFYRGVIRYFPTPEQKLEVELGYIEADDNQGGNDDDISVLDWGISYERQMAGKKFALFAQYAGFNYEDESHSSSQDLTEHLLMVGVRFRFNQASLKSNDRTGATFSMPMHVRHLNWTDQLH